MDKNRKWRKILAMMLAVVMMLQNAQSVMVFADVTNEQIEQRLAGNQTQTEEKQPAQSQIETRANGEEYKTQSQETQESGNDGIDIGSPESGSATTEAKTSNADVSATITQSVFQADVSGTVCNFVQMTAQITNNDTENPATGVSIKALLNSAQLNYVNGYGTETTGAYAYVVDSNNTADLPSGSADGYNQIVMWTDQTIGAGETVAYQFAAQIIPASLDGVVNAWYVDGTSCSYTWENTEILVPTQAPVEPTPEVKPEVTTPEETPVITETPEETPTPEVTETPEETPTPEVTEVPTETPTSEVTEVPEATPTPEPVRVAKDKEAVKAKKKEQKRLLNQKSRVKAFKADAEDTTDGVDDVNAINAGDAQTVIPDTLTGMTLQGNGKKIEDAYIDQTNTSLTVDGKKVTDWSNIIITRDSNIELSIAYEYPEVAAGEDIAKPTKNDNIRWYELPAGDTWVYNDVKGFIHDDESHQAGFYEVKDNKIYLYYDNRWNDNPLEQGFLQKHPDNIKGTFTLTMNVNKQSVADKKDIELNFPGTAEGTVHISGSLVTGNKNLNKDANGNPIYDENGNLDYTITLDPVSENTTNVEVTDVISSNLTFVTNSFQISKDGGNTFEPITANIDPEDPTKATITVGDLVYNQGCIIKYKAKPAEGLKNLDITNKAEWKWGNGGEGEKNKADSGNATIKNGILSKIGNSVEDNIVKYTIEVNKLKAKLIPDGSAITTIKLSDELDTDLVNYLYDTKVVGSDGKAIQGVSIRYVPKSDNSKIGVLTIEGIPDQTYAKITYSVQVKATQSDVDNKVIKEIVNKVEMTGGISVEDEDKTEVQITKHNATVKGDGKTIKFRKMSYFSDPKYGTQIPLSGIKFNLYKVDLTQDPVNLDVEKPYLTKTTTDSGYIKFGEIGKWVSLHELYYYQEVEASGYLVNPKKYYFVLGATDEDRQLIQEKCASIANDVQYYTDEGVVVKDPIYNYNIPTGIDTDLFAQKNKDTTNPGAGYEFTMELAENGYQPEEGGYSPSDDPDNVTNTVEYEPKSGTSNSEGKISFGKIWFKYEGTYTFIIKEKKNADDSTTIYDSTKYKVVYTVGRNTYGNLEVDHKKVEKITDAGNTTVYDGENRQTEICNIIFNNYTAVSLTLTKSIADGKKVTATNGAQFTFELTGKWSDNSDYYFKNITDKNGNILTPTEDGKKLTITVTLPKESTSSSFKLNGLPKGVTITVKEVSLPKGWSWYASVPEGNEGTKSTDILLNAENNDNKVTVTNSYSDAGKVTFEVKKEFNDWNNNSEFKFKIERCDEEGKTENVDQSYIPSPSSLTIKGKDEEKKKSFGDVEYKEDGIYYYVISEVIPPKAVNGQLNGITYDQSKTYVKVDVKPNEEGNGQKKIILYQAGTIEGLTNATPVYKAIAEASFKNSVAATGITLQLTKKLVNKELTTNSGFKFKITDITDKNKENVLSDNTTISEVENKIGKINFNINYKSTQLTDSKKTFTYRIEEVEPSNKNGIEYDNTKYEVNVIVAKSGNNLEVESVKCGENNITSDNGVYVIPAGERAANFVNTYKAETKIHFEGTKALENKALKGNDFDFQIKANSNTDQRFEENGNPSTKAVVKNQAPQADGTGLIVFPEMTYTISDLKNVDSETGKKYGEFTYTIEEISNNQGGITYSPAVITATVIVTDEGNGTLSTKVTYGNGDQTSADGTYRLPNETEEKVTFKNVYGSTAKIQIQGTKSLSNKSFAKDDFSFQITSDDDTRYTSNNPLITKNEEPENGIAKFVFPEITYTAANLKDAVEENGVRTKTFRYTISETPGSNDIGITYDKTSIDAEVILTDSGDGKLTAILKVGENEPTKIIKDNVVVYTLSKAKGKDATFNNIYDASVSIKLKGTKELLNNKLTTTMPFRFTITGAEGDNRFTVNNEDGISKLSNSASPVGIDHIETETGLGEFEFPLMTYTAEDLKDETPDSNGVRSKDFTYTIVEDKTGIDPDKDGLYVKDGVTYDNSSYTVTVHLEDNGKGKLVATISDLSSTVKSNYTLYTLPNAVDKNATFTNIYNTEGKFEIPAVKYLNGRKFKTGDKFTFVVTKNNVEFDKVTINPTEADGNEKEITFKTDIYNLNDVGKTYHYSIREDHENTITGVKNSNRVYEVSVTITDESKNGQLEVKAIDHRTITKEDGTKEIIEEPFTKATFINEYTADGTVQISAEKNLSPVELKDNEFSFTLTQTDENGAVLTKTEKDKDDKDVTVPIYTDTVKNQGSNVAFKTITYSQKDVGKTYYYIVKEDIPKNIPAGYSYSQSEYRVKVVVSAAEDGDKDNKLKVVKIITKVMDKGSVETEDIIFDNSYKAEGSVNFTAKKEVIGYTKNLPEFNFVITENGNEVAKGKNDKNGNIEFSEIKYTYDSSNRPIGEHTYIISEVQPKSGDNYIYDKKTYQAVINVTDNGDGTLKAELVKDKSSKEFTVGSDGKINLGKNFVNEEVGLSFRKTDVADNNLPGAVLTIYAYNNGKKGEEVTHWTTTDKEYVVTSGLVAGNTYILEETSVPKGYVKADSIVFKVHNDSERTVEVISGGQKDKNGNIVMIDKKTGVQILKVNEDGKPLAGASLAIKDSTGNIIDQWISTDAAHTIEGKLVEGAEYVLTEIKAPEGYKMASDVAFKANASDKPTVVTMKDDYTEVSIQKTDYNGKALSGATLELKDSTGKVIDTWKTDGTAHVLKGKLVEEAEYTLTETSAPSGYRVSLDIKFKVSKNEKVTTVVMKDAPTKASILKTDESGQALSGATLVVKDSTGKELDKWTTDGKAHEITGLLTVGETYTLSELSAPSGYTVAPDQTFKMEDKDVVEVTMIDYQESGSGQITVTKKVTLISGGNNRELITQDDTFYVNLFTDAAGQHPYKGAMPQAIHLVNASAGSVTFSDLAQGTYYVYETDELGNVINFDQQSLHNGSQFMCILDSGSNAVTLDLKSGPKEGAVNLENAFYDIPDGYFYKGEININKQVLKGTSQITADDTFYAGIFTKDDQGVYNLYQVVQLVQNDTVNVEVPLGGEDGTQPINYYILETDADGNIIDLDVFEYEVSGEGTVSLNKENSTGNINLVNKLPEETDGKLRVQKTDENGVGLAGASFRLTDEDGAVVEEWTSEASAHELELEPGTYTLTEVSAPTGYTGAGSVTIAVDEDYNISVSGEIDYSYSDDLLKIVNKVVNKVVSVTPQPENSVSGGGGGGSTPVSYSSALSGKVAVKTGDSTPIGLFVGLFVAAAALAGAAVYLKRRKKK